MSLWCPFEVGLLLTGVGEEVERVFQTFIKSLSRLPSVVPVEFFVVDGASALFSPAGWIVLGGEGLARGFGEVCGDGID